MRCLRLPHQRQAWDINGSGLFLRQLSGRESQMKDLAPARMLYPNHKIILPRPIFKCRNVFV
jgi:hypothetical protein